MTNVVSFSSRKYQRSKKTRSAGGYRRRLQKRGISKAPVMPSLDHLRKKQGNYSNDYLEEW